MIASLVVASGAYSETGHPVCRRTRRLAYAAAVAFRGATAGQPAAAGSAGKDCGLGLAAHGVVTMPDSFVDFATVVHWARRPRMTDDINTRVCMRRSPHFESVGRTPLTAAHGITPDRATFAAATCPRSGDLARLALQQNVHLSSLRWSLS